MTKEYNSTNPKANDIIIPIKVFLSHPSDDDTDKVKVILEKMSPQIELNMFPSTNYESDFTDAIRGSIEDVDVLVAILNKNGRRNQWVNQEVGIAVANDIDIVVFAEENARKKHLLKGFVNEKNWTIVNIDSDDLEDKLHKWLKVYQTKHGIIILQRLIIDGLKKLKRILDVNKTEYKSNSDPGGKVKNFTHNLESHIKFVFEKVREDEFIRINNLNYIKENITNLSNAYKRPGTTIKTSNNFTAVVNNSKLIQKIDRYIELRELET